MKSNNSLFLRQSYLDAWDDYQRSLTRPSFTRWSYVILTASNEAQAEAYRAQIEMRRRKGLLPPQTHFAVLPDPDGKRVGSGGATLNAMRYVAERENNARPFAGQRILVIHSGGDSKRVPQYSACGKLFSPVPRELPNGKRSTLFDEFIVGMSGVPGRIRDGMLVLSGDVLLLFNPLQIDFSGADAAAISFKEDVETGKDHGVFRMDENGNVGNFLHKQSEEMLRRMDAVNAAGKVDIDTGAVLLSERLLASLFGLISTDGFVDEEKFGRYVNERARLSFYGDFLYPLASHSTREQYDREKPEGEFCDELAACRAVLWDTLHPFRMRLLRLSPAAFIHFGTTRELLALMTHGVQEYRFLDWKTHVSSSREDIPCAVSNSVISDGVQIGPDCYIEDSYVTGGTRVGAGSILSFVTVCDQAIPDNVVLHGLKLRDGRFTVRIYGVMDNPKGTLEQDAAFLGQPISSLLLKNGIDTAEIWPDGEHYLWNAALYPVCDTIEEALRAALNVYALTRGEGSAAAWRARERVSLCSSFNQADTQAILDWSIRLRKTVKMERLVRLIENGGTEQEARAIFDGVTLSDYQKRWLSERAESSEFGAKIRLYYNMGKIIGGMEGEKYLDRCFESIRSAIVAETAAQETETAGYRIVRDEVRLDLPLRVNWGGGWSDTPPYCNEHGGTVLNAAISLNGELPVEVCVRRLSERKVVFESEDLHAYGEFTDLNELCSCGNPYDVFALPKAALLACGVLPAGGEGDGLTGILDRLGGGIYLSTRVRGVPKGSGLGTSSILSGACVKALYLFLGRPYDDEDLYSGVLRMEQLMSTGGGWQDQVGGLSGGIKYITSQPGICQHLTVRQVRLDPAVLNELNERFALIYTGQRRLARNLLRDVIGGYIGAQPETLSVLEKIQRQAALMRFELERGNIDGFAGLLNEHWELSKRLDAGSTNTCIDQIFLSIEDLIDGKMICGAGGGGFLQVILKRNVTRAQLHERLIEVFQDSGVDVWESAFVMDDSEP